MRTNTRNTMRLITGAVIAAAIVLPAAGSPVPTPLASNVFPIVILNGGVAPSHIIADSTPTTLGTPYAGTAVFRASLAGSLLDGTDAHDGAALTPTSASGLMTYTLEGDSGNATLSFGLGGNQLVAPGDPGLVFSDDTSALSAATVSFAGSDIGGITSISQHFDATLSGNNDFIEAIGRLDMYPNDNTAPTPFDQGAGPSLIGPLLDAAVLQSQGVGIAFLDQGSPSQFTIQVQNSFSTINGLVNVNQVLSGSLTDAGFDGVGLTMVDPTGVSVVTLLGNSGNATLPLGIGSDASFIGAFPDSHTYGLFTQSALFDADSIGGIIGIQTVIKYTGTGGNDGTGLLSRVEITAVPEPTTLGLGLVGACGLLMHRRRRH